MNQLDDLLTHFQNRVLFSCVAGSQAYGTAGPESDEDLRGLFAVPAAEYLRLDGPPPQLADERSNIVYFSLRRMLELLSVANPNVLELLFMPADCVRATSPEMEELVAQRQLFLTRQCADTHLGYAVAQIKRARGQNKWVNNPQPEERPRKEGFCFVVPRERLAGLPGPPTVMPMRPVPLARLGWDLRQYQAARVEHAHDLYRLYRAGPGSRGVFRGEEVACEPIPLEREDETFAGLLLFNDAAYRLAVREHQQYWQWRGARNEERWRRQEQGELDFDAKNLMHTVRLLLSGRSILRRGEPIVRLEGEELALLLKIRAGDMPYEEILGLAEGLMAECEALKRTSDLPPQADRHRTGRLLEDLTASWERRQG